MKVYKVYFEQQLPTDIQTAWNFFSSPFNLSKITPPEMNFKITNGVQPMDKMYAGMIINYHVSPLLNIQLNWTTEITHVKENQYFIDEQRLGPYALWHHQHHFKTIENGVLMTDVLHYAVPYGVFGKLLNSWFIKNKIKAIFMHRKKAVTQIFGSYSNNSEPI